MNETAKKLDACDILWSAEYLVSRESCSPGDTADIASLFLLGAIGHLIRQEEKEEKEG